MTERTFGRIAVTDVIVSDRVRKDFGDVDELADSMARLGQLQPIVITPERRLIAGERRLRAARLLGWEWIDCRVTHGLAETADLLAAEAAENTCRKPFTAAERLDLARQLQPLLTEQARARQLGEQVGVAGRVRDVIGKAVGWSGRTVEKALAVVDAAEDPDELPEVREAASAALERMLATGLVDPAYQRLRRARDRAEGTAPVDEREWAHSRLTETLTPVSGAGVEAQVAAVEATIAGPDGARITRAIRSRRKR